MAWPAFVWLKPWCLRQAVNWAAVTVMISPLAQRRSGPKPDPWLHHAARAVAMCRLGVKSQFGGSIRATVSRERAPDS